MFPVVREHVATVNQRLARHQPLFLITVSIVSTYIWMRFHRFWRRSEDSLWSRFKSWSFQLFRRLPFVRKKIETEMAPTVASIMHSIHDVDREREFLTQIPKNGLNSEKLLQKAIGYSMMNEKFDYLGGRVSGTVYTDMKEDHIELLTQIFQHYAYSNPLHPDVFPGARKMEAEVIRMVADLYHGGEDACGTMSSGGTESILLACFAHRNRANARGITDPVIVAPITAHAAFEKAANLLGIRIRFVAVNPENNKADIKAMRRAIDSDVCLLVGSAPCFSSGTIDDIPAIAALGQKYGIPVHVDACLGGFLVPFMEELNFEVPVFDFRLPGVCSISCDTHKYGYSPKGSSTVLYRSREYLHHQYFSITEWPGGIYATPTIAGSRAGLNIALTWATLLHFGRDAYRERARRILNATRHLADQIAQIEGLQLVGSVDVSVVAFRSADFNIYAVGDLLQKRGWNLNSLQKPDSIHFCLTYNQTPKEVAELFLVDLKAVCAEVRQMPDRGGKSATAAIYGMAGSLPDKSLIDDVAAAYLDACYAAPPPLQP